jgi:hypothetical protein
MTSERLASMCGLDRRKALELGLTHLDLLSALEADAASSTLDERNTIPIQALVDTSNAAGSAGNGDTCALALDLVPQLLLVALAEVLDDGSLHRELDTVEREEPDEVPYPDNSDPSAGDACDLGERPVAECSDDGRDKLGNAERNHKRIRRPLHKEEAMRASDEDEGLRDDGDLEVNDHVNDWIVGILGSARSTRQ